MYRHTHVYRSTVDIHACLSLLCTCTFFFFILIRWSTLSLCPTLTFSHLSVVSLFFFKTKFKWNSVILKIRFSPFNLLNFKKYFFPVFTWWIIHELQSTGPILSDVCVQFNEITWSECAKDPSGRFRGRHFADCVRLLITRGFAINLHLTSTMLECEWWPSLARISGPVSVSKCNNYRSFWNNLSLNRPGGWL